MSSFVRQQLFFIHSLFCFFLTVGSYCLSSELYQVSIEKDEQALRMAFKKGSHLIFDARLPYAKDGYNLTNLPLAEPYVCYVPKTKTFTITLDEPENKCTLSIAREGLITLTKLDMHNPFLLRVDGKQTALRASNTLIAHNDFELRALSTCCFTSDVSAQWEIGGKALFVLPEAQCDIYTSLRVDKDLSIEAEALGLPYGERVKQNTGRRIEYYNDDVHHEHKDFIFTKKDPRALIQSKRGNIKLTVDRAFLDGAVLIARGDVNITYRQSLAVSPHCNEHVLHKELYKPGWFSDGYQVRRKHELLCDGAVVSAGKDILLTHNGKTCVFNGKSVPCTLGSLLNEGLIAAHEYVRSTSTAKGSYYVDNVLPSGPVALPELNARHVSFKDALEKGIVKQASTNRRFVFVHPLNPHEEEIRPFNEFAFCVEGNVLSGREGVLLSPYLQSEAISRVLFESTHMPNLPDYRTNDSIALLNHLHDNGFIYALVRGTLCKVRKGKEERIAECTDEEQKAYQKLLEAYSNPYGLSPSDIKARIAKIKAGTHILNLSQKDIQSSPSSFIYYTRDTYKGKTCIVPVMYLTEKDVKENYHLATMMGKRVIIDNAHTVVNTGVIRSIDKLEIEAKTIVNTKTLTRHFRIKTPLPSGEIVGFDVELTVPKGEGAGAGIYNHGGTVFGTQNLSLIAGSGDIKNTAIPLGKHTVRLDQKALTALFEEKDQIIDYYPGRFISGGNMKVVAQAGHFLNEASRIVAGGDIHIKSYADVVLKSLVSHHLTYATRVDGMSVEKITRDGVKVHRSEINAQGNVFIESEKGFIKDTASRFKGAGFTFKSPQGNEFKPLALDITVSKEKTGFDLFSIGHVTDTIRTRDYVQTTFENSGKIEFDSGLDNVFQAVIFTNDKQPVHIVAARNNVFKGAKKHTHIKSDGWSFGVTFLGSASIQALANDNVPAAGWYLANEDPLLAALLALKESSDTADKVAYTTYSTIEALRLFLAYEEQAKTSNHPGVKLLGQRLGLTDASGKFNPRMLWRLGTTHYDEHSTETLRTILNGSQVKIKSGKQILFLDGTEFNAQDAILEGEEIYFQATQDEHSKSSHTVGMSAGTDGSVGVDASYEQARSTTHSNAHLNAENLTVHTKNLYCNGCNVNATNADINVEKNLEINSVYDTKERSKVGGSVMGGPSAGVSSIYQTHSQQTVSEPSGLHAKEHLNLQVGGHTKLNGAYVTSDNPNDAHFNSTTIAYTNMPGYTNSSGVNFAVSASTQGSDIAGISSITDARVSSESQDETTRATIDQDIKVTTNSNIEDLNRDRAKIHTKGPHQKSVYRAVIPIVDAQKFKEGMRKVKAALSHDEPLTSADFDALVEELGIQELTQEEKENIAQTITELENDVKESEGIKEDVNQQAQAEEDGRDAQNIQINEDADLVDVDTELEIGSYAASETHINDQEKLTVQEVSFDQPEQDVTQLVAHIEHNADGSITITYKGKSAILKVTGSSTYFDRLGEQFNDLLEQSTLYMADKARQRELLAEHFRQCAMVDDFLLDLIPLFGDLKVAYQTLTDGGASLKRKLAVLGLIAIPHAQAVGKTIRWGASKAFNSLKNVKVNLLYKRILNIVKPGYIKSGQKVAEINTKEAAEKIANFYKGLLKEAIGDGWIVEIPDGKKKILVRVMNAGSGGRSKPYFRITIPDKQALTIEGKFCTEHAPTHMDLTGDYLEQVQHIVEQFKTGRGKQCRIRNYRRN